MNEGTVGKRGRPSGTTDKSEMTKNHIYATAIACFSRHGYHKATLRLIAKEAGVSLGLLYRYFSSKQSIVLKFYDDLATEYADRVDAMASGRWTTRTLFALRTSLDLLRPHRTFLVELKSIMIDAEEYGIFSEAATMPREKVLNAFIWAMTGANNGPDLNTAKALGRLMYLGHLGILLLWLLDKSKGQTATNQFIKTLELGDKPFSLMLKIPKVGRLVQHIDDHIQQALFA